MAELCLAGIVANLEGFYRLELPKDASEAMSLEVLESRIRVLEKRNAITSPPPIMTSSSEALAWRVWRIRSRVTFTYTKAKSSFLSLLPDPSNISLEDLKNIVDSLKIADHNPPPWPKTDTDEQMLSIIVQRLCVAAGHKWTKLDPIPVSRGAIYATAVEISLDNEGTIPMGRPSPRHPGAFSQLPPGVMGGRKLCCGCCNCVCHNQVSPFKMPKRGRGRTLDSESIISVSPRRRGWKTKFNWLKKLVCWGTKDSDYASSITTGSSTII